MEKYQWTITQINEMEVKQTIEIEFGEWKEKSIKPKEEIGNIEDVLFF